MAGANLAITIQAKDQASSVIAGISKPLAGLVSGLGAIGLASIGLDSIGGAMKDFIGNAMESQAVQSQLNAVLKSTHGVAGMTADSVNDLANSLSKITPFDDEAIGSAENLLLTFTNVGKNVFPEATGAILDMSQALGQDLQSSTIQLGKALNDPIKGITALSRVGVSFTETQKKMIEQLVKAGKTEQAQKVILKELATEFGGAAKAAGQTFAGKMAILETQIGNVKEAIGGPLITALSDLMTKVTPLISEFADALPGAFDDLSKTFNDFIPRIVTFGQDVVAAFKDFLGSGDISQLLADLNDYFVEAFDISPGEVVAKLQNLVAPLVGWIQGTAVTIAQDVLTWDKALIGWIVPMIPHFISELQRFGVEWLAWIKAEAPIVEAQLKDWGNAFLAWISPLIAPYIAEMNRFAAEWYAWIQAQASILIGEFNAWARSFIAWIGPATVQFLQQWPGMLNKFLDWIEVSAGPILLQLGQWAIAFVSWIVPMIPGFLVALGQILAAIIVFLVETGVTLDLRLLKWGESFVKWIAPQIPGMLVELVKFGEAMNQWVLDEETILGNMAYEWGRNTISRFLQGLHSMSLDDLVNLAAPTPGSPISNLLNPPAAAPSAGSRLGYNDVHVHIYGNQSNPSGVSKAATDGVVAAQRSMGY